MNRMVRLIIVLILTALLWSCATSEIKNEAVIFGRAQSGAKVTLHYNTGMFKVIADTLASATGNFSLPWKITRPGIYSLDFGEEHEGIWVYAQPGWRIEIQKQGQEVVFSEDGVEENRFLQQLFVKDRELSTLYPRNLQDPENYKTNGLKHLKALREFIESAGLKDSVFKGTVETYQAVAVYGSLLNFPMLYQLVNTGQPLVLPATYYDFLTDIDVSSPYLGNLGNATHFLQSVFTAMETEEYLIPKMRDYIQKRAERIQDKQLKEDYILYALDIELFGYNQYLGQMMEELSPWIVTPAGREKLSACREKFAIQAKEYVNLNAGQPAFDFCGVDVHGKKHALSDFLGKVVVVDVWNTGCKPCIAEIPYLEKLEEQFAGQEVAFISLSLEDTFDKWKTFVATHQLKENQWIEQEAFKSSFARDYHVRFVPRFMIIGKNGKIVEVYAPRPSDPRLKILIESELKK